MSVPTDPDVDPPLGPAPAATGQEGGTTVDLGRRTFFRRVAGELVQTAASLTGVASVAQGAVVGVATAAQELATQPASPPAPRPVTGPSMEQLARRHFADGIAPWSWDGDRLLLLDQRRLPAVSAAFPVGSAGEAARAVGERVVTGPSAAVVAIWGLALSAEAADRHDAARRAVLLTGSQRSLLAADPGSHVLRSLVAVMVSLIGDEVVPREAAARLEADLVAGHAELAAKVGETLAQLGVGAPLLHGPGGALWGAGAGTTLDGAILVRSPDAPPAVLTEGRPWLDGARVMTWELAQRGVASRVLLDAAGPGAVARGEVDGVLCVAERVALDGTVSVPVGGLGLAIAAAHAGVPFVVAAADWALDATAPDAATLAERPLAPPVVARTWGGAVVPVGATVDAARIEVVPAPLVSRLVTVSRDRSVSGG